MIVERRQMALPRITTLSGAELEGLSLDYECYGTLNTARDNAILICHYFAGDAHAAGVYQESDTLPGFWDALIGPGKVFDTDRYCVVCIDSLVNVNLHAAGSGPQAIDPHTGQHWGTRFPDVTIRDFVVAQRALLQQLGIERLHTVAGPSMGSMQALTWAALYPDAVGRVIAAIPMGLETPSYLLERMRQWAAPICLDPAWQNGAYALDAQPLAGLALSLAMVMHDARHWGICERTFARTRDDNGYAIEQAFQSVAQMRASLLDANAICYLARANQRYSLLDGSGQGNAADITAPVLFAVARSDLMLRPEYAQHGMDWLRTHGKSTQWCWIDGDGGHLDGLERIAMVEAELQAFLAAAF